MLNLLPSCSCLGVRIQWFRIHTSLYVKCGATTTAAVAAGRNVAAAVPGWIVAAIVAAEGTTKDPVVGRVGL